MKVVTVDQMQCIEADSDAGGHSYAAMMEQAGLSVARAIEARKDLADKRVLVLVGPGNNGGDGLVAARFLSDDGGQVTCYLCRGRNPGEDENFRLVLERDIRAVLAEEDEDWENLRDLVLHTDILIDALLGTGTRLPLRGELADMLKVVGDIVTDRRQPKANKLTSFVPRSRPADQKCPFVVGVDGPTGMDYDSGHVDELIVPADLTVTFAYPKIGHFRFPAASEVGDLVVADIGIDPALAEGVDLEVVTPAMVQGWLPARPESTHKGTFGKALIVAGSVNYTGAAYLAGASATRAGAGLVTVALPTAIHSAVAAQLAEATYVLLPQALGVIGRGAVDVLRHELEDYDVLLIGPGLGREGETVSFIDGLLVGGPEKGALGFLSSSPTSSRAHRLPALIVDADGLNILSGIGSWPRRLPPASILTPHPGEMARLMGSSVTDVEDDRVDVARSQAAEWGHVVVLKGAFTVVAAPDGRTVIEPFANAGLATAGTGDVLAGTITALRAQGLDAFKAAAAGAYLHGLAGELARETIGAAGMVAGDVLAYLPDALRQVAKA